MASSIQNKQNSESSAYTVADVRKCLGLQEHFEGGCFRETWRSSRRRSLSVSLEGDARSASSSIYYVMAKGQILSWHRLRSDNTHTWHMGGKLKIYILDRRPNGPCRIELLGNSLEDSTCSFHVTVPNGHWYAAEVIGESDYTLWGEIVTPGWEAEDFEEATIEDLIRNYPKERDIIEHFAPHK